MLGIRRGNAFRHVTPHHRSDGAARSRNRAAPAAAPAADGWEAPVLGTVAATGEGVGALAAALERHAAYLETSGQLIERRRARLAARTRAVLARAVQRWVAESTRAEELLAQRLDEVADGRKSPYDVAAEILDQLKAAAVR
jgi:LAO/AO transport system kinase